MNMKSLVFAVCATLMMPLGANAGTVLIPPTVNAATVTAGVVACGPCGGADSRTAIQGPVSVEDFGENYNATSFIPALQQTGLSTPGEMTVSLGGSTATASITTYDPSFTAVTSGSSATANPAYYTQGAVDTGSTFNYWFEVVNPSDPTSTAATTVDITAKGAVSLATAAFPGSAPYSFNDGNAGAELTLSTGCCGSLLSEEANAYYSYYDGAATNNSTSNVTGTVGPSSSMSGSFKITNDPVTLNLDTQYEVSMNVWVQGSYVANGTAYVDPIITSPGNDVYFSPGIGSAVPEPSTWIMMLLGFAGLGFAGYRQMRSTPPDRLSFA
jgi:hypothetical protein